MSLQSVKAKLLAVGLLSLSACGTAALFGSVPVIARMLSNDSSPQPYRSQAFPQTRPELRSSKPPAQPSFFNKALLKEKQFPKTLPLPGIPRQGR